MDGDELSDEEAALKHVFEDISLRDLVACTEVNRRWRSLALASLRERLPSLDAFLRCWPHPEHPNPKDELFDPASCADIMASKVWHYRKMAAKGDMWPSLALIVSEADITGDRNKWIRVLLPPDCPVVYVKQNPKPAIGDVDPNHHMCGVFIFSPPEDTNGKQEEDKQPGDCNLGASSAATSGSLTGSVGEPSSEAESLPQVPIAYYEGATLQNEAPGVLVLQSVEVAQDCGNGSVSTSRFTDSTTGRIIQVTTGLLFGRMSRLPQAAFFKRLQSSVGSMSNTVVLLSGRVEAEFYYTRVFLQEFFEGVPGIEMRWTLSFVSGPQEILDRLMAYVIIFKLLK